jgi:hypothetical protein
VALGKAGAAAPSTASTPAKAGASANPIEGVGNALKGLFQK